MDFFDEVENNKLELSCDNKEQYSVISIKGELDLNNVLSFKAFIKDNVPENMHFIVLNVKDMTYIDSSGIGALIILNTNLKKFLGRLIILNANEMLKKIFKLSKLDKLFTFTETLDDISQYLQQ